MNPENPPEIDLTDPLAFLRTYMLVFDDLTSREWA